MAISLRNKSVFLLQASQGPLVSSVTRQSMCCMSSDSIFIDNSIGPNYIMYVNFHLHISTAWTSLPTASHCPGLHLPGPTPCSPSAHRRRSPGESRGWNGVLSAASHGVELYPGRGWGAKPGSRYRWVSTANFQQGQTGKQLPRSHQPLI